MYNRWLKNKDFREYFLHKLDNFLKGNNLNLDIEMYDSHPPSAIRDVFEFWLDNSDMVPVDENEIKLAEDFNTPWDAFDYFFEKNKNNGMYFSKGYNQLWCTDFK